MSTRTIEVNEAFEERWVELQALASSTQAQAGRVVRELLAFMVSIGASQNMFEVTPYDIVCFFMEKDAKGQTVVHDPTCPYVRSQATKATRQCSCKLRLNKSTLDAQIGLLRGAFRDLGASGPWCNRQHVGNPCDSQEVRLYLKLSSKEQLRGGVAPKQAPLFDKSVFEVLMTAALGAWSKCRRKENHIESALAARDALFYSIMWSTGLRAADALRLLKQDIEFAELSDGPTTHCWYMHTSGSKTEGVPGASRLFQLFDDGSSTVPMAAWSAYTSALNRIGIVPLNGPLFRDISSEGEWLNVATYKTMAARFKSYTAKLGLPPSMTLHGFHGSHAAEREAEGVPRPEICREMSWQESTRAHYVDGREIMTVTPADTESSAKRSERKLGFVLGGSETISKKRKGA
jgi:integrase